MREDPPQIWVTPFHQLGAEAESQKEKERQPKPGIPLSVPWLVPRTEPLLITLFPPNPHRGLHLPEP